MPVVISQVGTFRRVVILKAGSAPRLPGQGMQIDTPPSVGMPAIYLYKSPTAAGKCDAVLSVAPSGFPSLTSTNGQGQAYDVAGGGEQRLLAGPGGVAMGDVVIDDADGNWVKQAAGELGKYVALEGAAAGASFGARPALNTESN